MRMIRAKFFLAMMAAAVMVGACETAPPGSSFPDLTYEHLGAIGLDVGSISVANHYVAPLARPHVEHLAPVRPAAAMTRWVKDRLRARGQGKSKGNRLKVTIRNASIVEVPLRVTGGVRGAFTTDQSHRYDAALEVVIELFNATGFQLALIKSQAKRYQTVAEGTPMAARERVWFEITEAMMKDINAQLEKNIRTYLGDYLR